MTLGVQLAKGTTGCRKTMGAYRVAWHASATARNECRKPHNLAACVVACQQRQRKVAANQCLSAASPLLFVVRNEGWMPQTT